MTMGRLIRVRVYRGDPATTIYVVAERDSVAAIRLLEKELSPAAEYEDLGRVNDTLLDAMQLKPGQFSRL